ncbi:hypothetical protein KLP28_10090 [Nocardioidaceae bacterium]|nr:hypothetical protein KLP28_10090 [Nocardioidaceae bacterium]
MSDAPRTSPWDGFEHRRRTAPGPRPAEVGAWLVTDADLPDLDAGWADEPLHVRVDRGAGDVSPALAWAARGPATPRWLGLALRDEIDTDVNVRRVVAALDDARAQGVAPDDPDELSLVLTLPSYPGPAGAGLPAALLRGLDEIAAAEAVLAVPCDTDPRFVADLVEAALDREVAMVAARVDGPTSRQHAVGWRNLLAGVRASLDGEPAEPVLVDPAAAEVDDDTVRRTRRWLRAAVVG